jgi:hypothetical protein
VGRERCPKDALTRRPIVHCGRSVNGRVVIGRVIEYAWAAATHASDDSDEASISGSDSHNVPITGLRIKCFAACHVASRVRTADLAAQRAV